LRPRPRGRAVRRLPHRTLDDSGTLRRMPRRRQAAPTARTGGPARLVSLVLAAILLVFGITLRARAQYVPVYTPDQHAYPHFYPRDLHANGLGPLPKVGRDYNRRPEMLQYPSPTRVGHLVAILAWMNVTGIADIQTAAQVSMIASIVLLVLVGGFCVAGLEP